jgi:hypothetical protein
MGAVGGGTSGRLGKKGEGERKKKANPLTCGSYKHSMFWVTTFR